MESEGGYGGEYFQGNKNKQLKLEAYAELQVTSVIQSISSVLVFTLCWVEILYPRTQSKWYIQVITVYILYD